MASSPGISLSLSYPGPAPSNGPLTNGTTPPRPTRPRRPDRGQQPFAYMLGNHYRKSLPELHSCLPRWNLLSRGIEGGRLVNKGLGMGPQLPKGGHNERDKLEPVG